MKLATKSLPVDSTFFQRALHTPEVIDTSDLSQWDGGPPYATLDTILTTTPSEMAWTAKLMEIWHGYQLRLQRDEDRNRRRDFKDSRQVVMMSMKEEVERLTEDWQNTEEFLKNHHEGARETAMAEVFHQWQARYIYHIYHLHFLVEE